MGQLELTIIVSLTRTTGKELAEDIRDRLRMVQEKEGLLMTS